MFMAKVRIKKAPRTGSQEDYALVYNSVGTSDSSNVKPSVKNTMTAVPRDEPNVEVENGETVVGDINYDGLLELMSFQGKRHSEGGIPVNIPDGSFIFSDTPKLKIKDPEILKYFDMGTKKSGYTPAKISKKYQVNEYIDILKDDTADEVSKRTAHEMLKNNTQKLAELAIVQEGMKGFENGIPSFAENVMAGLQGEQPQMKEGGYLSFFANGGEKDEKPKPYNPHNKEENQQNDTSFETDRGLFPHIKETYYFDGEPYRVDPSSKLGNFEQGIYVFKPINNEDRTKIKQLTKTDFNRYLNSNEPYTEYRGTSLKNAKFPKQYMLSTEEGVKYTPPKAIKFGEIDIPTSGITIPREKEIITNPEKIVTDKDGRVYYLTTSQKKQTPYYEAGDPVGHASVPYYVDDKFPSLKWTDPKTIVNAIELEPQYESNGKFKGYLPTKKIKTFGEEDLPNLTFNTNSKLPTSEEIVPEVPVNVSETKKEVVTQPIMPNTASSNNELKYSDNLYLENFKKGGELKKYQPGGTKEDNINKYGYHKDTISEEDNVYDLYFGNLKVRYVNDKAKAVELSDGTKYIISSDESTFINKNNPKDIKRFTQYDELPKLTSIATKKGVKFDPTEFTNVVNVQAPQRGSIYGIDMTSDQWSDFERRHGNFIEKSTGDGFEDWKTKVEKGDKGSVAKFQKAYNDYIGYDYFKTRDTHKDPYGVDDKLGWITFSAPALYTDVSIAESPIKETETPPTSTDPKPFTVDEIETGDDFAKETPNLDTWFAPDIMNFVGAMTDPINRYEPSQGKVNLVTPGYDLLDPTRQLAANQEQMARFQNQLENSVDPQIALSASLAASGEGFQNAANVLANVENANVGVVNQAYQQNAAIENSEIMANENARQKYIAEMAMLNENEDKAKSLKKWRVIGAFNQGWHNYNKDQMMEQVLFPQVYTNNITGDVRYSGNGRAVDEYNTYSSVYGIGNTQNPLSIETMQKMHNDLINQGFTPDFAEKLILKQIPTARQQRQKTREEEYEDMMKYGGYFNINDYIGI
jgi:hypothetical protein